MEHDEDLLEQLYWEFDNQRKRSGDERFTFKAKVRLYATIMHERMKDLKDEKTTPTQ